MACSLLSTINEIKASVHKQIGRDTIPQQLIIDVAVLFNKAMATKEDTRKAYKECKDISQEKLALIDNFFCMNCRYDAEVAHLLEPVDVMVPDALIAGRMHVRKK
ncbi:hypothetical protein Tco_1468713 [Tanacetum coccineum]